MNKRNFLKSVAALSGSAFLPSSMSLMSLYKSANAEIKYEDAIINAPAVMPQVINIFLYGGPSELSGNLTNIVDIEANSQNKYAPAFSPRILVNDTAGDGSAGWITKNGFWRGTPNGNGNNPHLDVNGAGGRAMQFLVDNGHMSVYRTLMKRLNGTRSHRESLLQAFKGSLDIDGSAGVGTKIAATLFKNKGDYEGSTVLADGTAIADIEKLLMPFISFEGDTRAYQQDPDFQVPLLLRGLTLDQNFENPYTRNNNGNDAVLEALADLRKTDAYNARYLKAANAFDLRKFLEGQITKIQTSNGENLPVIADAGNPEQADIDAASLGLTAGAQVTYPNNNRYTDRVRAAVTLALVNPSSVYIAVGGGLGGWDDHNNGVDNYGRRMNDLFEVMKAAMLHIKYFNNNTLNDVPRTTNDNIVINMCGDFGRRVNLNGNQGWDHGNNQNFYTLGGAAVRQGGAAALGKVVGKTVRVGTSGTNNQVTEPDSGSYEAEPMSVASTVFSYFGVQNPEILTADPELNPAGVPAIDETQPAEPDLFTPV